MQESWRRKFATMYVGQAFSLLSSSAVQFAIIWWITLRTESAIALTVATVAGLLPQVLVGPVAGVWIDRFNRRTILILADASVAASSLALGASFLLGTPPLGFVYAILFLRALGETFHKPAMKAAVPQLVPAEALTKAGGFGQMIESACAMAGPLLGAFLMDAATLSVVMLVDVAGAVLAVLTLSRVRLEAPPRAPGAPAGFLAEARQALAAIRQNTGVLRASITVFLTSVVFLPLGQLLPLMVLEHFQGGTWQNGIVRTLFSAGMLISAMLIGVTGGLRRGYLMMSISPFVIGICSLASGLLPANLFALFCAIVFVMGMAGMWGTIPYIATIQRDVPTEVLGKVMSLVTSAMSLGVPLGMLIAGPLAEAIGVDRWMAWAGTGMILLGVGSYFWTRGFERPLAPPAPGRRMRRGRS